MADPKVPLAEVPVNQIHAMCGACWFNTPGNVFRTRDGKVIIGAVRPPTRDRVRSTAIMICCICQALCQFATLFREDPDAMFCDHDGDGKLVIVEGLSVRRSDSS